MATILNQIDKSGSAIYYSRKFRQMLEDHLTLIQGMTTNTLRTLGNDDWAKLNRFEGDFYGFLNSIGVQREYHWTVLRMNGFRSRFDLNLELTQLVMPDWSYIDKLAQLSKEKSS